MTDDLLSYLDSLGSDLLIYLDDDHELGLGTVEHLYRQALALLQGRTQPEKVASEWEDFFVLADAFVLAYGSRRLDRLNRRASLLATKRGEAPPPMTGEDLSLLVDLVRELGEYVAANRHDEW